MFAALAELVAQGEVAVLSGAGLSTESGLPDYRGETGRQRPATPMNYQEFTGSAAARQRYWARSYLGWPFFRDVLPNDGHRAVAELQRRGLLTGIITQNVDGLHQAAAAADVNELHGGLARVRCLQCAKITARQALQERLATVNSGWQRGDLPVRPDGDVDLDTTGSFVVVDCDGCGGILKPDVVFFGETVPRERAARAFEAVDAARTLLVLGSSLTVMSGYRFALHAKRTGLALAIVNQGPTRADLQADVKVEAALGHVLVRLIDTHVWSL
jgi:NAD-dependent SIR2 family protein deacetylase